MGFTKRVGYGIAECALSLSAVGWSGTQAWSHHASADQLRHITHATHSQTIDVIDNVLNPTATYFKKLGSLATDLPDEIRAAKGDLMTTVDKKPVSPILQTQINNELQSTLIWSGVSIAGLVLGAIGIVTLFKRPKVDH